jgi:diacylglycerol O-acyltransferase
VRFVAPVDVADPETRIRQIGAIVRAAKAEPALDAMTPLAPALVQLPDRVLGFAGRAQDRLDMQASYVPGPPVKVGLAGAGVEWMWAFGPLPGPAAMSVLLTYEGVARIGLTVDAIAIPDIDALRQAMVEGFAEVLGLGHVASADGA